MNKRIYDKRLDAAKRMPPMHRRLPGCEYNAKADQVIAWVSRDVGMQAWLVETLARIGYIQYDRGADLWKGKDYDT